MDVKNLLLKELLKNGYEESNGKRIWNLSNRSFLHLTTELSKSFLKVLNYEPYRKNIREAELALIEQYAGEFIKKIGLDKSFNLIDIGCGPGEKSIRFVKTISSLGVKDKIRYCPLSSDEYLVKLAIKNMEKENFEIVNAYSPQIKQFDDLENVSSLLRSNEFQKNVFLLHGSILASYEINEFLFMLSRSMMTGDYIIIGNGIRKGERFVELDKYRHQVFHNWFVHLMKAIGFNEKDIEYSAEFRNARLECFYKLKKNKTLKIEGKKIELLKGDEILIFKLYKYYLAELDKFFRMYFKEVSIAKDSSEGYILALCKK